MPSNADLLPRNRVKRLIKKFSNPDLQTPPGLFEENPEENTRNLLQDVHIQEGNDYTQYSTTRLLEEVRLDNDGRDLLTITEVIDSPENTDTDEYDEEKLKSSSLTSHSKAKSEHPMFIDSRTSAPIPEKYLAEMLPFQAKDFSCRFTLIQEHKRDSNGSLYLFVPTESDYFFYQELKESLESIFALTSYSRHREAPAVFHHYCRALMQSGFDPREDTLVRYLATYMRHFRAHAEIPAKVKLIARMFSTKGLRRDNVQDSSEIIEGVSDTSVNAVSFVELGRDWLKESDEYILSQLHGVNLNLLLSRGIRYATFCYWQGHILKKRIFLGLWQTKYETRKRLRMNLDRWEGLLKRKVFVKMMKSVERTKAFMAIADDARARTLKKRSLGTWRTKLEKLQESERLVLQSRRQYYYHLWQRRLHQVKEQERLAIRLHEQKSKRRMWKAWRINAVYQMTQAKRYEREAQRCAHLIFSKILKKYEKIQTMQTEAKLIDTAILCGPILLLWIQKYRERTDRFQEQLSKLRLFTLKKYFVKWRHLTRLNMMVYDFQEVQNRLMKLLIFKNVLQKQNSLFGIQRKFEAEKNVAISRKYFENWLNLARMKRKAIGYDIRRLKTNTLRLMNHYYESSLITTFYDFKLKKKFFRLWMKQQKLCVLESKINQALAHKYLHKMLSAYESVLSLDIRAEEQYEYAIKYRYFSNWQDLLQFWKENEGFADMVFMKNKLQMAVKDWKARKSYYEEQTKAFIERKERSSAIRFFKLWQERTRSKKAVDLELILEEFLMKKNETLKADIFYLWIRKLDKVLEDRETADLHVKRKFFLRWIQHYNFEIECNIKADAVYDTELMAKYFQVLIDASNKRFELRQAYQNLMNAKNYNLVEHAWQLWSLRYVKIKQLEQPMAYFIRKWDKYKARRLLMIWKEKLNERNQRRHSRDSSILGNILQRKRVSPIKSYKPIIDELSFINEDSYQEGSRSVHLANNNDLDFDYGEEEDEMRLSPSLEKQRRMNRNFVASSTPFAKADTRASYFNENRDISHYPQVSPIRDPRARLRTPMKTSWSPEKREPDANVSMASIQSQPIRNQRLRNWKQYYGGGNRSNVY